MLTTMVLRQEAQTLDALAAQRGDVNLRGSPEVACDEGHHAGEARVTDEGVAISTPHTTGDTEVRDDGGELLLEIHSGVTGVVEQGGDPRQRGAIGPGAAHPCSGPDRPSHTHCRSPGSLGGDHLENAPCRWSLPATTRRGSWHPTTSRPPSRCFSRWD